MKTVEGGIIAAQGFLAAGEHIGVKRSKKDLALIQSTVKAVCAGVFTQNKVKAAPVLWDMDNYKNDIYGIAIVSGNANACTGQEGIDNNFKIAKSYGEKLNVATENILVCSTGVIGVQLPIDTVLEGIKKVIPNRNPENAKNAAEAICTTDTFVKETAVEIEIKGKTVTLGGIAKGSGMIHPNMATLLSFITTDANITQEMLQLALSKSADKSYNMISVDGDTSTNDTVLVLANGESGCAVIDSEGDDFLQFCQALDYVNIKLAKYIAYDGEGATKFVEITVEGAASEDDAKKLCKSVITSSLVKTALFGADANWGRVLAAMGYSGAEFNPEEVTLYFSSCFGRILLMDAGRPIVFDEDMAKSILTEREIKIEVFLTSGKSTATAWGCDLSYDYVKINGDYRS